MLFTKIMYLGLLALGASAAAVVPSGQLSPPLPTTTSDELSLASPSLSPALLVSTQAAPAPVISQSTGVIASESTTLATVTSSASAPASASLTSNGNSTDIVPGSGWATFYNDNVCTANGGEAVSISNKGCLGESGRNSIYIQPGESDQVVFSYSLVLSPSGGCNCQVQCIEAIVHGETNNFCYNLNGHAGAESFRFIQGSCGDNNC